MRLPAPHRHSPRIVRVRDGKDTLKMVRETGIARPTMRSHVSELGRVLAEHTYEVVRSDTIRAEPVLCVFVLRGGALLYPAFSTWFTHADACFLGMRRTTDGVVCDYATPVPQRDYHAVIIADSVVGTGATVEAVRAHLEGVGREVDYVAALCSSADATRRLADDGLTIIGMALDEKLDDGLVLPDLGNLDAGDLFSRA